MARKIDMSKYFKFRKSNINYGDDITLIRRYLEEVGEVTCTDTDISRLWGLFSDSWDASWLTPDEDTLSPFSHWLDKYDDTESDEVIDDFSMRRQIYESTILD